MNTKRRIILFGLLFLAVVLALALYVHNHNVAVLNPKGVIAAKERHLIVFAVLLSVIVVVPVYAMAIMIAWKYRESNAKPKKYNPDWDHSRLFESMWWGIPIVIIGVLSVVTWNSAHALDPYKSLASTQKPLPIQVVALDWKWLFIYPEQHIASVNLVPLPVNTPINFELTSDTVMNSFWVPSLSGQIYAMPGMSTELHLMASKPGSYIGSSANISGSGFAGMTFTAKASSQSDFNAWVKTAQHAPNKLDEAAYTKLTKPSKNNAVTYYSSVTNGIYDDIVMKYMMPGMNMQGAQQ